MEQDVICPRCGKDFKVSLSGKPGIYNPTCPICSYNFRVKLKHPSDGYVKLVENNKHPAQIVAVILIIAIIISAITIAALAGWLTPKGTADIWITNCLDRSVSYELYIDGGLYKSGTIEPNQTKKCEAQLETGEHTITLKAAGQERIQKPNIEAGKTTWLSFMIFEYKVQIPIYG